MLHEHLYYPTGPGVYGQLGVSFSRLYLAGGVTTMRTAGNVNGIMDINLARRIAAGELPGRAIDATAPYLNGPNTFLQMHAVESADAGAHARGLLGGQGATSFKAYMQISRAALKGAIDEGAQARDEDHRASLLGDLRRGRRSRHRQPRARVLRRRPTSSPTSSRTSVPGQARGQQTIAALDENGEPFKALVKKLVDKHVALTSTLTVFETFTPRPSDAAGPRRADAAAEGQLSSAPTSAPRRTSSRSTRRCFRRAMRLERAFVKAGGTLIAGTDPTGSGGVVPGYADQRQIELLVEEGFTPLEAISIGTLNGAKYLGRDATHRLRSPSASRPTSWSSRAIPSTTIADIRKVDTVFKQGVGFDPAKLIESVKGQVGIW